MDLMQNIEGIVTLTRAGVEPSVGSNWRHEGTTQSSPSPSLSG